MPQQSDLIVPVACRERGLTYLLFFVENRFSNLRKVNFLNLVVRVGKTASEKAPEKMEKTIWPYCLFPAFRLLLRTATDEVITSSARHVCLL